LEHRRDAPGDSTVLTSEIDFHALDALFAPYDRTDGPGFAVGVAVQGRPVYRRGFGMASIELPVALSPSIRMRIGSTSKHFTALAVMLLQEDGKLALEDSLQDHMPDMPDWSAKMTLRHLLAHTSGMRDCLDLVFHSTELGRSLPVDYQLKLLSRLDSVNFAPGTSWNYNNGGYLLLSEIVSRTAGLPFATFLQERIFTPLGMHDTMLRPLDTDLVSNSATLHVPTPDGAWRRGNFGAPITGEGGIVSTVDDMLKWLAHMSSPTVGTRASWAEIRTPLTPHGYGLGLFMAKRRGQDRVYHSGAVIGGACQMVKLLGPELDIIVITNGRSSLDGFNIVEAIIDQFVPATPVQQPVAPPAPIEGNFYSANTGRKLSLTAVSGKQGISIGAMTLPAERDQRGAWLIPFLPSDLSVAIVDDDDAIDVNEFGITDRLIRVTPPDRSILPFGRYEDGATGLVATICADRDDSSVLRIESALGGVGYSLAAIGPDLWEARSAEGFPLAATLEFDDEGFRFTTERTTRLRFRRS
jgi:CubicO group peptidase (beta-lactamase class C family)